ERAWEFGGEGLRKFDLVRWNIYGQKIVETKKALDNIGKAAHKLELTNPEVAQYANLADYLYYQRKNGKITFLNTAYIPAEIPENIVDVKDLDEEGNENAYARANWARNLFKKVTDESGEYYERADYTTRIFRGYKDESGLSAVPYLLPISTQTIDASKFLTNDGYGHVMTAN
ncbi:MAG TPA: RagB/SusD family nutrient uptake outer membrane protein, partial [Fermentimonas sp.]|nr:RagB/SusD family nutrient uptake outer membrane protein [Fermentimonas sp.]